MARWRLTDKHYLNTPGIEWEYKETDRQTSKQARKVFAVPQFLNPEDPADQNYPGEIIVCHEGKGQGRDITFEGAPTPDMEPLDAEAAAITDKERPKWVRPMSEQAFPGQVSSQSLLNDLTRQLAEAMNQIPRAPIAPVAVSGVSNEDFEALKAQVAALAARNAELMAEQVSEPAKRRA